MQGLDCLGRISVRRTVIVVAAMVAAFLLWGAVGARAATTWTVTSTSDDNGSTACNASNSTCPTLRDALNQAAAGDTIVLPASQQAYAVDNGELEVTTDVTIQGAGANAVTISAGNKSRVFEIESPNVTISGVTITQGDGDVNADSNIAGLGGGIYIDSGDKLTLLDSVVSNNTVNETQFSTGDGGGIYVEGTLDVQRTTITGNQANASDPGSGGGVFVDTNATASISETTINGNSVTNDGGGVATDGTTTIVNSTINGNSAATDGGGIFANSNATLTLTNVTVASNSGPEDGANFYSDDAEHGGIQNTIFADPRNTDSLGGTVGNCDSGATFPDDEGNNLSSDNTQCWNTTSASSSDLTNTDPKLGPLADNGGPTQTMALQPGSPAIDAAAAVSSVTTDQRGVSRPQGPAYDIGAFEVVANADMGITKSGSPNPVTVGHTLTYTLTATNHGPAAASGVTVSDTLPGSVTFKSASASQGSCSNSSGTVSCNLGTLANGASATVTITVTPNSPGTITNTARVSSSATDTNSANNSASATTQVQAVAAASGAKPQAVTKGASAITFTSATLHGSVNPGGAATTYSFQFGKTKGYGSSTAPQSAGSGTSFHAVTRTLHGLAPGTVYHYRVVAKNANGMADGLDRTFRTPTRPSIHVNPSRVLAGARVRVFGNAGGCPVGDQVTLLSHAFSPAHEFAGVPAVFARVGHGGSYSTTTRVPSGRSPARYLVTARCGGGNLGVSAHLTVFRLPVPKFTG